MPRVLFIAYLFPPIANSGTRRSLSFVNHLPNFGWEPLVLTVADPPAEPLDPGMLAEVAPGTRVERVPLASRTLADLAAGFVARGARRKQLAEGLEWRLRALVAVPDQIASWYPSAVRRGVELHREVGFDAIYATAWPYSSFVIARAISQRTGCPYVLDYRDEWKPSGTMAWETQSWLQGLINPRLERWAGARAAHVVTVTRTLVDVIRRDSGARHVHCITNGFEPSDFAAALVQPPDEFVRVAYTGVWRQGYGPDALYRAVRRLKDQGFPQLARLKVTAAGFAPGLAGQMGIADIIEELGRVEHSRAVDIMRNADMLFLPVPEGFYADASLPGKLFEYFGSEQPIVAAVPQTSETARVLADVGGAARIDPGDDATLAQMLERLCAGDAASLWSPRRPERLQHYTRSATTGSLARVLEAARRGETIELAP